MSYDPLKNISSEKQQHYYPNILKMTKDQKELENLISQYKNAYQEFENTAKSINNNSQWVIERNVMLDDLFATPYIPKIFATNINQEQCILECLNDPHCDFILFSDSGNGACAANKCLKFSKNLNTENVDTSQTLQNIINAQNYSSYDNGINLDNPACKYKNQGPTSDNYSFVGWTKPTWFDMPNATFTTKHALGSASSLKECKKMALREGPHPYVEFTGATSEPTIGSQPTNCYYATVVDNNLRINNLDAEMNSNIVSLASQNNTDNMLALQNIVEKLHSLNGAIHNKLHELEKQNKFISKKNLDYESRLNFKNINYSSAYQKLNNDRKVLRQLYDLNNTQDQVNENIKKNLDMKKSRYWFLEFLI